MGNLYVHGGGGAGDFIYQYFNSYAWRCLPSVLSNYSDAFVTAIIQTHHPSLAELVYLHPAITAVTTYKWYMPGDPKERWWKAGVVGEELGAWAQSINIKDGSRNGYEHKIYLTVAEENLLKEIKAAGPYVIMHPFAGLPHRGAFKHPYDGKYKCYPDYKYLETATYLAERGYKVYFVGRTATDGVETLRSFPEDIVLPKDCHPNIMSLVNKYSFRFNVEVVRRADGFIGSHSSMLSAAWTNDVPSIFFYPCYDEHGNKRSVLEHGGHVGTWALHKKHNKYFEMSAEDFLKFDSKIPAETLLQAMRK